MLILIRETTLDQQDLADVPNTPSKRIRKTHVRRAGFWIIVPIFDTVKRQDDGSRFHVFQHWVIFHNASLDIIWPSSSSVEKILSTSSSWSLTTHYHFGVLICAKHWLLTASDSKRCVSDHVSEWGNRADLHALQRNEFRFGGEWLSNPGCQVLTKHQRFALNVHLRWSRHGCNGSSDRGSIDENVFSFIDSYRLTNVWVFLE